ncbi:hypothetical protein BB8028_0003g00510 [Beauveria bassiana]|uniref:Uncharacterized protein n=1 Tax=Beauveria bassiana TaxID=176275 RepID=A0A2S7Y5M7_BEABA|nr:hypothetical protein BB8028_0003g00510 [Beauveria bassiana]
MVLFACQEINPAAIVTECRSTTDVIFHVDEDDEDDDDGEFGDDAKRNFCADIISGKTVDVSAENAKLPGWSVQGIHKQCKEGNTLMSVCQDIASAAVVACK